MNDTQTGLFNRSFGSSDRQVLAFHCTMAHSGAWRGVSAAMPEVTITAPDMLSHGRSRDWDRHGSDYLTHMVPLVEPLLDRPMDVVGHSFGGLIALNLAARRPDRVRSLTLVEPVFFAVAREDRPDMMATHDADAGPYIAALKARDFELGARLFNRMWTEGKAHWDDMPEPTRKAMARGVQVVADCAPSTMWDQSGMLRPEVLERVKMPTLILTGGESHPIMRVVANGLMRRLPNATAHRIRGAGHMLPITHPYETAQELRGLMSTLKTVA